MHGNALPAVACQTEVGSVTGTGFLAGYFTALLSVLIAWGCWRAAVAIYRELGREPIFGVRPEQGGE